MGTRGPPPPPPFPGVFAAPCLPPALWSACLGLFWVFCFPCFRPVLGCLVVSLPCPWRRLPSCVIVDRTLPRRYGADDVYREVLSARYRLVSRLLPLSFCLPSGRFWVCVSWCCSAVRFCYRWVL